MTNILRSDFYKMKRSKTFWICSALCIIFGILFVIGYQAELSMNLSNPNDPEYFDALKRMENISGIWALEFLLPIGIDVLLLGVFVATFISSEFSFGTIKNTLSRGADRSKVFLSKTIVCSLASTIMLLLYMLAVATTGTIIWGYDPHGIATFSNMLSMVSLQILMMFAYATLFTFTSMTIRSSGGSIMTNILCTTMSATLFGALSMLFGGKVVLNDYWIGGAVKKLSTLAPASADVVQGILVALIWGGVSVILGIILFRKTDVK